MQDTLDALYAKSKENISFSNIMQYITKRENILLAYRNIKSNSGSKTSGIDGKTIQDYKDYTDDKLVKEIASAMKNYKPDMIKRVFIPKKNGKMRPLGIPTIKDRIIQQSILQIMEPICEAKFHPHSYGFRPNRSTQHAIARFSSLVNISQMTYVVDMDIQGFFENVNHKILRQQIWKMGIHDKSLLAIISKMLKAPIDSEGIPDKGTPQGSILSPLLANIVLNDLDWWVSSQWETFKTNKEYSRNDSKYVHLRKNSNLKQGFIVRYADDFKIICSTYQEAQNWFHATEKWLHKHLKLNIAIDKSKITDLKKGKSEFLGFDFRAIRKGGHKGRDKNKKKYYCVSDITLKNQELIVKQLKYLIKKVSKNGTSQSIWELNTYIIGIHEYYNKATNVTHNMANIKYKLDDYMFQKFKRMAQMKAVPCNQCSFTISKYMESRSRTYKIKNTAIVPIAYIQFKKPMLFSQEICDYTINGREKNRERAINQCIQYCVKYLSNNFIPNRSIEYNDNRISLFSAHKGKCYVSGIDLTQSITDYHCHHKIPKNSGGKDDYKNLCPLHKDIHILVHAVNDETISKYIHLIKNKKQLERLNELRQLANLEKIIKNF